jgi:hypothetical protein
MLRHLTLPYVSYWSFGEQLPVLEETTPSTDQIAYALETVAAIVANGFDRTDLLADNRDAYVAAAQGQARTFDVEIVVSSPRSAERVATEIVAALENLGIRAKRSLSGDIDFLGRTRDKARHLCLVIDEKVSRWQTAEAEWFLRRTLVAEDRRLFPVLTSNTPAASLPGFLRNIRRLELGKGLTPHVVALILRAELIGEPSSEMDAGGHALAGVVHLLEEIRQSSLDHEGWFRVEQALLAMRPAAANGDLGSLMTLAREIELITRTTPPEGRHAPPSVTNLVSELVNAINRRAGKFPRP